MGELSFKGKMGLQKYYPGCRKDAQCKCKKCVESLHATRDLRPPSATPSSASRVLNALGLGFVSPLPTLINGGGSSARGSRWFQLRRSPETPGTPLLDTRPRTLVLEPAFQPKAAQNSMRVWRKLAGLVSILVLLLALEFLAPLAISRFIKPELSPDAVARIVEESRARVKVSDRLDLIQRRIQLRVGREARVSNCTGSSSKWNLVEEGAFIHSYCKLYSSRAEQVSLWGYPLATAGVLGRGPVDRYMTVLSGRVFQWKEGQLEYTIHNESEPWTHHRWTASAIHLDKNTWIVEYSDSGLGMSWGGVSATVYALRSVLRSLLLNLKWLLDSFAFFSLRLVIDHPVPT